MLEILAYVLRARAHPNRMASRNLSHVPGCFLSQRSRAIGSMSSQ